MLKVLVAGAIASLALFAEAQAQTCSFSLTSFSNGSTADATAVNGNFTNITNCINTYVAPLANPHFTGNVGIGASSPATSLQVTKTSAGAETVPLALQNASSSANTAVTLDLDPTGLGVGVRSTQIVGVTNGSNQTSLIFRTSNGGPPAEAMRINSVGNIGIGTPSPSYALDVRNGQVAGAGAYVNTSDGRLKKDITPITYGIDTVMSLRPVGFYWKEQKQEWQKPHQLGLIAQEVEKVVPEAVTKAHDAMETRGLAYDELIPILIKAMQQQQAEIEQLKAQVAALKASH